MKTPKHNRTSVRIESSRNTIDNLNDSTQKELILKSLSNEDIGFGRAVELLGISKWKMFDLVSKEKVDWVQITKEELDREAEILAEALE